MGTEEEHRDKGRDLGSRGEKLIPIETPFRKHCEWSASADNWEQYEVRVEEDDRGWLGWVKKGGVTNVGYKALKQADVQH